MSKEELKVVLSLLAENRGEGYADKPVWQQRGEMDLGGLAMPMPEEAIDIVQVRANGVPGLKIVPQGATDDRALLYFHGGGYVVGSPLSHRHLVARIAVDAGVTAWSMDYRMGPEHPHPAAVEDAVASYRHLLDQGVTADRIVVGGDSAGGGLTCALLIALKEYGLPQPAGALLLSPWVDLTASGSTYESRANADPMLERERILTMASAYVADGDPKSPTVSPLFADLSGIAPLYIQVGDAEVLLDDSLILAEKARSAAVDVTIDHYPDMIHVWQYFWPMLSEAREACQKLSDNCRSFLKTP